MHESIRIVRGYLLKYLDSKKYEELTYEEIANYMFYKQQLIDEEWYETVGGDIS